MSSKKTYYFSSILLILILLISCSDKVVTQDNPLISITPNSLDFGSNQIEMYIYIANSGGGTLNWSIDNSFPSWISISHLNGVLSTDVDTVTIVVNRDGMNGENINTLNITSNGGDGEVEVIMIVPTSPTLAVSPTLLNFGDIQDELTFQIFNSGPGTIDWTISENLDWLEVSPQSGSTSSDVDTITININRPHSSSDTLAGDIFVDSNGGSEIVEVLALDDFNGIYIELIAERYFPSGHQGGPRDDILIARFDSVFAPCGSEISLTIDSVYCNEYSMTWDDEYDGYTYTQIMPRSFLELGANYEFNVFGNNIVPSFTSSILFPEYEPQISEPADMDSISGNNDLNIVWNGSGEGTVFVSLISEADSACAIPGDSTLIDGIFVTTDNDGAYTITSDRLSAFDSGQYILILNDYNITYIIADGIDSRSYITGLTTNRLLLYLE